MGPALATPSASLLQPALVRPAALQSQQSPLAEMLVDEADAVLAASHANHELYREEMQQMQQNKLARIIAAASFEAGVAEGERRAQNRSAFGI